MKITVRYFFDFFFVFPNLNICLSLSCDYSILVFSILCGAASCWEPSDRMGPAGGGWRQEERGGEREEVREERGGERQDDVRDRHQEPMQKVLFA